MDIVTKEDLQAFRVQLLQDIRAMISVPSSTLTKQWLKSTEVQQMLKISSGTLQNLRIKGVLRFTKMGGSLYYKLEDIEKVLESGIQ
jgi:Helix-turn-helix domain